MFSFFIYSIFLLYIQFQCVRCQQFGFISVQPSACSTEQYYNFGILQCGNCQDPVGMLPDSSGYSCTCRPGYKADINNVRVLSCQACSSGITTPDGYFCSSCSNGTDVNGQCTCAVDQQLIIPSYSSVVDSVGTCSSCSSTSLVNTGNLNCVPCPECCFNITSAAVFGGLCFNSTTAGNLNGISIPTTTSDTSPFITLNVRAAYGACVAEPSMRNQTACEQLSNMCVMEHYSPSAVSCTQYFEANGQSFEITDGEAWRASGIPWLYYSQDFNSQIQEDTEITTGFSYNGNSRLELFVAQYRANGTFLGISSVEDGLIQLCKDKPTAMNTAYIFGTTFLSSCTLDAKSLFLDENNANIYFDMFLQYTSNAGEIMYYPIPVLIENYLDDRGNAVNSGTGTGQFTRRFFLIDNVYSANARYASSMQLLIRIRPNSPAGLIYPPILRMSYSTVDASVLTDSTNPTVPASFTVTYSSSVADQNEAIKITLSVFGVLAFLYAAVETSGWRRRQGLPYVELTTLIQFMLIFMGNLANVFFVFELGYTTVLLIFFKGQDSATSYVPSNDSYQNYLFIIFISVAFACKFLQVFVMIFQQSSVDIFLIDWERPRAKSADDGSNKVSIWRTYFIANEWNEIQTFRKINTSFQLLCVLLFLEVVGFKNLATLDSSNGLNPPSNGYEAPTSNLLRFAVGGLVYVIVALVQVIYFKLIHERFISDKTRDFVDLCSLSNISVFVLAQQTFGYYIHGRSVHGRADTDMAEMNQMLKREEENLVSTRGLLAGSEDQVFEIMIPLKMRQQYDKIYQPLQLMKSQPAARGGGQSTGGITSESMKAYSTMRTFLTSFINHSLRDLDYNVRDKLFLEKLLNIEFQEPIDKAFFTIDDAYSFADILFYGHEFALLVFDILLFSLVDYGSKNFVLAAVITYIVGGVFKSLRGILGRYNLARKTLIDKRLLI
ncbi:meckelin-like [Styela clava]